MNPLKIPENLQKLRRDKKITQEELADFIGVTKASVSKWENGQSMPDILLLPQLATYFNVSLDELFGYEPQLNQKQIQRLYVKFAAAFARRPFEDVLAEVRDAVRQYYACYPLLLQICVLYLNHFTMAGDPQKSKTILAETGELCAHIMQNCKTVNVVRDAASIKALVDLQLGQTESVIETLEPMLDPTRISMQDNATLIQAYQIAGSPEKAVEHAQVTMYLNMLYLISTAIQYLAVNAADREACEETIRRVDAVAKAYRLKQLHPNAMAQFLYQAALHYVAGGEADQALERLEAYVRVVGILLQSRNVLLHGDPYFNHIDSWIEKLALGANPPRDMALIRQSTLQSLEHPAFQPLRDTLKFKAILLLLTKEQPSC